MANFAQYADMVKALCKDGQDIINQLTPEKAHLWHMGTGVSGESGELVDAIKKAAIYAKPLDRENVIEELGDLEFYMEGVRQGLGITREETLEYNMKKLGKRYSSGTYQNQHAIDRVDKATKSE